MADIIVIEVNATGNVLDVGGDAAALLGTGGRHLIGRPLLECINVGDAGRIRDGIVLSMESLGSISTAVTLRLLGAHGRWVWVRLWAVSAEPGHDRAVTVFHALPFQPPERLTSDAQFADPFHALVQQSADIVTIVEPDGRIGFANPAMVRLLSMEQDELVGTQILEIIHPGDHDLVTGVVVQLLEEPGHAQPFEFRARHADGTYRWVDGWLQNLLDHPDVNGLMGNGRDVTARHHAQVALAASEARFRSLASSSPSAIFELDDEGIVCFANDRWYEVTGRVVTGSLDVFDVLHADDAVRLREHWNSATKRTGLDEDVRVIRPDGVVRSVELRTRPIRDQGADAVTHVGSLHDVTELRDAHSELAYLASHDTLTNLPNRGLLLDRLADAVDDAQRTGGQLALLFVDLDRFKIVNDSLGHHAGDKVLLDVSGRLADLVRPEDVVARFGGDEFVILCAPIEDHRQAAVLADRVRRGVAGDVDVDGDSAHVTVSVGFVIGDGSSSPESLLRDADAAMYEAKTRGRDRAQAFDEAMHRSAVDRLALENALRRGLERGEFRLYFQPIVDLIGSQVWGVEALLRWDHPERGLLVPEDFLGVAEESGILAQLGGWVLQTACRRAAGWSVSHTGEAPRLFVNFAANRLDDPFLVRLVADALSETELDPGRLVVEVTEGMLMTDPSAVAEVLGALRELDVRVAIDDFGTGYSSLSYLTKLPVDVLKIDESFVAGLADSATDREVAAAIVALSHAIGLQTVAEGVESAAQLETLIELKCDLAQGFLFSEPLSGDRLDTWFTEYAGALG